MQLCPVCNGKLLEITDGKNRGLRCHTVTCLFNFQDQICPKCGKKPTTAQQPYLGLYRCTCSDGHTWSIPSESDHD